LGVISQIRTSSAFGDQKGISQQESTEAPSQAILRVGDNPPEQPLADASAFLIPNPNSFFQQSPLAG
jgi:hypothetical protein